MHTYGSSSLSSAGVMGEEYLKDLCHGISPSGSNKKYKLEVQVWSRP